MYQLVEDVVNGLIEKKLKITTAESCTGGLLAAALTEVPGVSACFETGYITYSEISKISNLRVMSSTIINYGSISKEAATEMALTAQSKTGADIAVAITGNAGPDVMEEKPVGLVYIAFIIGKKEFCKEYNFAGNRQEVRELAVKAAIDVLGEYI